MRKLFIFLQFVIGIGFIFYSCDPQVLLFSYHRCVYWIIHRLVSESVSDTKGNFIAIVYSIRSQGKFPNTKANYIDNKKNNSCEDLRDHINEVLEIKTR